MSEANAIAFVKHLPFSFQREKMSTAIFQCYETIFLSLSHLTDLGLLFLRAEPESPPRSRARASAIPSRPFLATAEEETDGCGAERQQEPTALVARSNSWGHIAAGQIRSSRCPIGFHHMYPTGTEESLNFLFLDQWYSPGFTESLTNTNNPSLGMPVYSQAHHRSKV